MRGSRESERACFRVLTPYSPSPCPRNSADRAWVGGQVGMLAVRHTGTRPLDYPPHAHLLVTAGGLAREESAWVQPAQVRFLMPGYMLSALFRAQRRDALTQAGFTDQITPTGWERRWTVDLQPIGRGDHALRYLARYVFHVALTNARLERFEHGRVAFRYTHARTQETRHLTRPVDAFLERFLQHVLPRGFTKIRSFGLLSPSCRAKRDHVRHLLERHAATPPRRRAPSTARRTRPAMTRVFRLASSDRPSAVVPLTPPSSSAASYRVTLSVHGPTDGHLYYLPAHSISSRAALALPYSRCGRILAL